jgi:hypothetical protein
MYFIDPPDYYNQGRYLSVDLTPINVSHCCAPIYHKCGWWHCLQPASQMSYYQVTLGLLHAHADPAWL